MKRVLFVEDNDLLRDLYGALLNCVSNQWQPTLARDGKTALKLLESNTFDAVISDLHMPGMSGIELLTKIRELYPQTSRILISGYDDQGQAADSLKCTHWFISKPFDGKTLRATLARIGSLDEFLKNDQLRCLAGHLRTLPSFPTLYLEIVREIESPKASIQGIAKVIARDPAITAKVLQVANSAAYGRLETISDPVEAIQQLGMSTVRSLALSAKVYSNFAPGRLKDFSAEALWSHLMKCGEIARAIMRRECTDFHDAENAFTAGMLHDMGKLMLADSLPDEFGRALALAAEENIPLHEAELRIFGATHAGLGAYLFGLWGLPPAIVEAVAFHHHPGQSDLKKCCALTAVHAANALANDAETPAIDRNYLREMGLANRLDAWREIAAGLHARQTD